MKTKDGTDLIELLKSSEVSTHYWHLQTKYYAEHMALGAYYGELQGLIDVLVERWQGYTGNRVKSPRSIVVIDYGNSNRHFNDLCDTLKEAIKQWDEELSVQDALIDILSLVNKTKYLLTLS